MVEALLDDALIYGAFAGEDELEEHGDCPCGEGTEEDGGSTVAVAIVEDKHKAHGGPGAQKTKNAEETVPIMVLDGAIVALIEQGTEGEVEEGEEDESDENDREGPEADGSSVFLFEW